MVKSGAKSTMVRMCRKGLAAPVPVAYSANDMRSCDCGGGFLLSADRLPRKATSQPPHKTIPRTRHGFAARLFAAAGLAVICLLGLPDRAAAQDKPVFEVVQTATIDSDRIAITFRHVRGPNLTPDLKVRVESQNGRVSAGQRVVRFFAGIPVANLVLSLVGDVRIGDVVTVTLEPDAAYAIDSVNNSITVTVPAVDNGRPMPTNDSPPAFSEDDASASGNVLTTDTDPENDELTVTRYAFGADIDTAPAPTPTAARGTYGSLVIGQGGVWTYTPSDRIHTIPGGGSEREVFTYEVSDRQRTNSTATASLTLTITGANDRPMVANAISSVPEAQQDMDYDFEIPGNTFADPDRGDMLTYTAWMVTGGSDSPLPAWLAFDGTRLTGRPAGSDVGTIMVRVIAEDRAGQSDSETFAVTVAATPPMVDDKDDGNTDPVPDVMTDGRLAAGAGEGSLIRQIRLTQEACSAQSAAPSLSGRVPPCPPSACASGCGGQLHVLTGHASDVHPARRG